jgi:hypothetical protein
MDEGKIAFKKHFILVNLGKPWPLPPQWDYF